MGAMSQEACLPGLMYRAEECEQVRRAPARRPPALRRGRACGRAGGAVLEGGCGMDCAGDAVSLAELLDERRHLLDVAYRMVGSSGEAEGIVDETYRRWYALSDAARADIATPRSWLATTAAGLCRARP